MIADTEIVILVFNSDCTLGLLRYEQLRDKRLALSETLAITQPFRFYAVIIARNSECESVAIRY